MKAEPSTRANGGKPKPEPLVIRFADNRLLPPLFGEHDRNLARIEESLGVQIASRGNRVSVSGNEAGTKIAADALNALYRRLERGLPVDAAEADAAVRLASAGKTPEGASSTDDPRIITPKRHLTARSPGQVDYMRALADGQIVFGLGPAGTGKTYLAVAMAVEMLMAGRVDRIILSRPAVEAGERLGFLPGDLRDKIDPYLTPLYDALYDMMPGDQVSNRLTSGEIEVAPLAFMRGRTLSHAFVILDEAQNATRIQMQMFLTRLGEGSRMVITGDPSQVDLPTGAISGLSHAVQTLRNVEEVSFIRFTGADVVRHRLVTRIVQAYDEDDRQRRQAAENPGHS